MKVHNTYTIVQSMTAWNSSYKESISMKCFIILALLNFGKNLKKSFIVYFQNVSPYKSRLSKMTNLYGSTNSRYQKLRWKTEPTISFWRRKTCMIAKCMLNIEINRKILAEKQLQIIKNLCRERRNLTQKHFSDMPKIGWISKMQSHI